MDFIWGFQSSPEVGGKVIPQLFSYLIKITAKDVGD